MHIVNKYSNYFTLDILTIFTTLFTYNIINFTIKYILIFYDCHVKFEKTQTAKEEESGRNVSQ